MDAVERSGASISCRAGCGACCRQVVPITETEARHVRDLVEAMPEPRRQQIRERFAAGRQRLEDAGLLETFQHPTEIPDRVAAGMEYFRLGIACPFLEDESCSIHPDRPLSCREYLVANRYTLADIGLYAYTHVAEEGGFPLDRYPAIRSWCARIAARPAYRPITSK